jgi:DNA-binding PadR family transcriptional regulator
MSTPDAGALTTTSYALLAQLALRPWSAYELAVQQERYLRFFWPRAARALYNELKRLDALGFAAAEKTFVGRRARTMYTLTDAGRAALTAWLDTPVAPLGLEFEGLLRVFNAHLGSKEQLLANLERIRADVAGMTALNDQIIAEYAEGRAPFQHQAHLRTLGVDFFTQFLDAAEQWVERTIAEVRTWDDLSAEGRPLAALHRIHRQRHGPAQRP